MSESGPVLVEREVPNPAYERLEDLLTTVERAKGVHANGLRRPVQLMGEGAWSGRTAARPFELELQGRHTCQRTVGLPCGRSVDLPAGGHVISFSADS